MELRRMSPVLVSAILLLISSTATARATVGGRTNPTDDWILDNIGPHATYEDCGSLVPVTDSLDLIQYDNYILGGLSCIWVLDSNFTTLEIYTDHFTLPYGAGLVVYYFADSTTTTFTVYRVPPVPQSKFTFPTSTRLVLLVLSSGGVMGSGSFRVGIRGVGPLAAGHAGYNIHRAPSYSAAGQFTSGQYANNERSAIVVQPSPGSNLMTRITEMDLENGRDFIYTYTLFVGLGGGDRLDPVASFTGYHPFGPPGSTFAGIQPRVYILISDNSIRGNGFRLTWS